jgi:preprotein translocase subunit YajC
MASAVSKSRKAITRSTFAMIVTLVLLVALIILFYMMINRGMLVAG